TALSAAGGFLSQEPRVRHHARTAGTGMDAGDRSRDRHSAHDCVVPRAGMAVKRLNVVHICDHLGWAGTRIHGVQRLVAWMLQRFDHDRFDVSLISLRHPDTSPDTLEALGIPVTYLSRSKF